MSIFFPHWDFHRIYEIPTEFFRLRGVKVALLDVDNTLTTHDNPIPHEEVLGWLERQRKGGLRLMILSNNTQERVAPFAEGLGLEYIADARKPLGGPLRRALERMGVRPEETAVIGDQIFTDILCARLAGCTAVLVEPMEAEPMIFFRFKRALERPILRAYRKRKERG